MRYYYKDENGNKYNYKTPHDDLIPIIEEEFLSGAAVEYDPDNDWLQKWEYSKTLKEEIASIEKWFEWYDIQTIQYARCVRLGAEYDKDISELDSEAITKAARLKELRNQLKEL